MNKTELKELFYWSSSESMSFIVPQICEARGKLKLGLVFEA